MPKKDYTPKPLADADAQPFDRAEEAWFWFINAQAAKNDGARVTAGASVIPRPCEPADILLVLDELYRNRRLERSHLLVLRHYGRRQMPPDPRRVKEVRSFYLWKEALERIEPVLVRKGIVRRRTLQATAPNKFWVHGAKVYDGLDIGAAHRP